MSDAANHSLKEENELSNEMKRIDGDKRTCTSQEGEASSTGLEP